ncbi:hypothetical protein [Streptomyces sp. x-80]
MPSAEAGQPGVAEKSTECPCDCVISHVLIACMQLMQPCPARDELGTR